jgi:hypothetical protein
MDTATPLPLKSYDYKSVKNLVEMLKVRRLHPFSLIVHVSGSLILFPQEYNLPTLLPSSLSSTTASTDSKIAFLSRRHRHFTTLWNANADVSKSSPAHKTAAELRKDLERWEATMEKEKKEKDKGKGEGELSAREYMVRLASLLVCLLLW